MEGRGYDVRLAMALLVVVKVVVMLVRWNWDSAANWVDAVVRFRQHMCVAISVLVSLVSLLSCKPTVLL